VSPPAKIQKVHIPEDKRVICISDIHGELDLFKRLLAKTNFGDDDLLILLGDLYTKGSQCHETLQFCRSLSGRPNVLALRGNADWGTCAYLSETETRWLDELPHIIDAGEWVFVHSGLSARYFTKPEAELFVKYNNFMHSAPAFDKWVVVGHWPVAMYCHGIPCHNPIIDEARRIISIDGGNVIKAEGQLNAFIIEGGQFSFVYVDNLPTYTVKRHQEKSGGRFAITWPDRFVEMAEDGERLCHVRHLATGKVIVVPKSQVWTDADGKLCCCDLATDYHLPCSAGDVVSVVEAFEDRLFVKREGVSGWIFERGNPCSQKF